MGRFIRAMRAGIKAMANAQKPGQYSAGGIPVACPHCANTTFELHGPFHFENLGDLPAHIEAALTCLNCGLILWFGARPTRL
jgi:ribosomal protein S27E